MFVIRSLFLMSYILFWKILYFLRMSLLPLYMRGIIIGCRKCGRSSRDISSDLKYRQSTVAYVIKKWKVSGDCRNVPRISRPTKLGDWDWRVLSRETRKNHTQPVALIREEIQQESGSIVSLNTIHKEAWFSWSCCCP